MNAQEQILKVGELAARAGLTVRTLHHYDNIGLLSPSVRSEAGYRLYNRTDVKRLHSIQMLRRMGLSLGDIASVLEGEAGSISTIFTQQLKSLEQEIARATQLRQHLSALQAVMAAGKEPTLQDWLDNLALMGTYAQYFSVEELGYIFEHKHTFQAEWSKLLQAVREAMSRGVRFDSIELQPLVQQWMDTATQWMKGEVGLLRRWTHMSSEQPDVKPLLNGADRAVLEYMGQAIRFREGVLGQYLTVDELRYMDFTLGWQMRMLAQEVDGFVRKKIPCHTPEAQALAQRWHDLLDRMVHHDAALREKIILAYTHDLVLRAGMHLSPTARDYLKQAKKP